MLIEGVKSSEKDRPDGRYLQNRRMQTIFPTPAVRSLDFEIFSYLQKGYNVGKLERVCLTIYRK